MLVTPKTLLKQQAQTYLTGMLRKPAHSVVIVGGGVVGSSIAYHLSTLGVKNIVVLEKDSSYKYASAMLSAGGIRQQFSVKENVLMSKFGAEFMKNPSQLHVEGDDVPDFQFKENGYLFLSSSAKGLEMLQRNNQTQRDCGVDWMDLANPAGLAARFPWLSIEGLTGGSYGLKNEGYFDPWSLLLGLKRRAIANGVEYREGTVVGAKMTSSPFVARIDSLLCQKTDGSTTEEVSGGLYVNAAGPWAGSLVDLLASRSPRPAGISPLPVKARKRSVFLFHCKQNQGGGQVGAGAGGGADPDSEECEYPSPGVSPLVVDPSGTWFRSEGTDGSFICGTSQSALSDNHTDLPVDADPDHSCVTALRSADHSLFDDLIWPALYDRVPAFGNLKLKSSWAGFYEYNTFDQNAIIGLHPEVSNLMLCNGFSGHGLQQSPASGRAVAELVAHGEFRTIDLKRFSFERILNNTPIFEDGIV